MLEIWGRATSSNVQALMWCIGELGLDYIRHDVGHRFGGTDSEEFVAMNPNRRVPVLRDDSNPPLWETGAILRYLATQYGDESFWPTDPVKRAEIDKWAEWSKINIAIGFTGPVFSRVVRTKAEDQDPAAILRSVTAFESSLSIAENQLTRSPFLAGDALTLADIQFAHVLYRYYDIDIQRRRFPVLSAYYAKIAVRPAYRKHVMVSYEELRER